jgi:hypothetical protein
MKALGILVLAALTLGLILESWVFIETGELFYFIADMIFMGCWVWTFKTIRKIISLEKENR